MHVVVAQAVRRQSVQVRGLDRAAEAAQVPEAGVVEDDEKNVRRPSFARLGSGQAGDETSAVRPMTPGNVVPDLYSLSAISFSPLKKMSFN